MISQGNVLPLIGRVLIVLVFLFSGWGKLTHFDPTVAYITKAGMPAPQLAAIAAIVIELGFSILMILGWQVRIVAIVMALYTVIAGFYFHQFWAVPPEQYMGQFNNFFKNIAIAGGFLFMSAMGAGPYSLDNRRISSV